MQSSCYDIKILIAVLHYFIINRKLIESRGISCKFPKKP